MVRSPSSFDFFRELIFFYHFPALFPAAQPPTNAPFTVYANEKGKHNVIVAETESMEWDSRNHLGIEQGGRDGEIAGEGPGYSVQ